MKNKVVSLRFFTPLILLLALYPAVTAIGDSSCRGWEYVAEKLYTNGIRKDVVQSVYASSKIPEFQFVPFSLVPRETHEMYEGFTSKRTIESAQKCRAKHKTALKSAYKVFNVDPSLITAILIVETHCGQSMGKELVVNRLSRLAAIDDDENIKWNVERLTRLGEEVTYDGLKARAKYLNDTFFPELLALFQEGEKKRFELLSLRGSSAGAFGMSQFLPSTYLKYGVDGNKDGVVSLFEPADAIWSVAYFFAAHGWKDDLSEEEKRKIIWKYNKSEPYIDAVLRLSEAIR